MSSKNPSVPTPPAFIADKTIIVAGAGIGGLAFAISLRQQWPSSSSSPKPKLHIYERDSYENRVGREGYTLSLRTDFTSGGIQALDRMGLYERVQDLCVAGSSTTTSGQEGARKSSMVIWDSRWRAIVRVASLPVRVGDKELRHGRIRRNVLQGVLADAAIEGGDEIHWGTKIVDVTRAPDGKLSVSLSDGSESVCDVLVAADGARSAIRGKLRPDDTLDFAGVVCLGGTARYESADEVPKPLDRDWGAVLGGKGVGLFMAPVDERSALWSLSWYAKEPRERVRHPMSHEQVEALLKEARSLAKTFPPRLDAMISATDPTTLMLFNAMDRPPLAHTPAEHGPVVWIGDANHAVSPFAGNGANMALMDGWDLAGAFCRARSLAEALEEYDGLSMKRAGTVLKMSRWSIDMMHATGLKLLLYLLLFKILGFFGGFKDVRFGSEEGGCG